MYRIILSWFVLFIINISSGFAQLIAHVDEHFAKGSKSE
jgi:hypothetical protein